MSTPSLFDPYPLGPNLLKNRIVMAPLTRSRAGEGEALGALNARYYAQRAGAGLIISEATQVSQQGQGYLWTPGIYSEQQVAGWKLVVDAVHGAGGSIFQQLWHVGRISHTTLQPNGEAPISSTEEPAANSMSFAYDAAGKPANVPVSRPRQATAADLAQVVADYGRAGRNLKAAGFDGAEIHGANGYLFDQFLNSMVNCRSDAWGDQTPESRTRLLLEAYDAVAAVIGADRTGVRISPFGHFGGMPSDPKAEETFFHLAEELDRRKAVYIHIVRGSQFDPKPVVPDEFLTRFRQHFHGSVILTGRLDLASAERYLADGQADLLGFGTLYISNPDLVERLRNNWPLEAPDLATLYGGGAEGYTDYPIYESEKARS